MTTTKQKCEFYFHLARHTRATPGQVQRLLRYAATLQRLAVDQCNREWTERDERKRLHIRAKVAEVCQEITCIAANGRDTACAVPVHSNDPRGCVLKIRVPDGFSDSLGGEGICVPA